MTAPIAGLGVLLAPQRLCAQGAGAVPAFSEEARRRLLAGPPGASELPEQARQALLEEAERQLAAGDAEAALEALERVALMRHTADTELRIVRAHMALGQYRRALTFAAHTAGAHREQSAGAALYAWLLHLGGQQVVAARLLADALQRAPDDALLEHAREQLASDWPRAGAPLRQPPWQAAPTAFAFDPFDAAPAAAQVVGTAMLLHHGREAVLARSHEDLAALEGLDGADDSGDFSTSNRRNGRDRPDRGRPHPREDGRIWLRNGLGQTVAVVAQRRLGAPGLHLLVLRAALPSPRWSPAPREPFAGSPGFTVEYAPDAQGHAAWPLLRQGFFAGVPGVRPHRPLGIATPIGPRGGPVFDAAGRLAGVASVGETAAGGVAADQFVGLPLLRELLDRHALPASLEPGVSSSAQGGVGLATQPELAYEAALRGALQVLVTRHRA